LNEFFKWVSFKWAQPNKTPRQILDTYNLKSLLFSTHLFLLLINSKTSARNTEEFQSSMTSLTSAFTRRLTNRCRSTRVQRKLVARRTDNVFVLQRFHATMPRNRSFRRESWKKCRRNRNDISRLEVYIILYKEGKEMSKEHFEKKYKVYENSIRV